METNDRGSPAVMGAMRGATFRRIGGFIRRRIVPIAIGFAILAIVFLVTVGASLPDDGAPIVVSEDAALSLANRVAGAVGDAPGARAIDIAVTDTEVTSLLSIAALLSDDIQAAGGTGDLSEIGRLGLGGTASPATVPSWTELIESQDGLGSILTRGLDLRLAIRNPEVRFTRDGAIIIRGHWGVGPLSVPARAVVVPQVVDGALDFEVVEGQLGRLPLPGGVANLAADAIERALLAGYTIAHVERIAVDAGSLHFVGSLSG
ncbi:MAG: hypothetical protein WCC01_14355 [Acidimicrobiia bacterium]